MVKRVIIDSGFWYALYDTRDQYSQMVRPFAEQLKFYRLVIPWPSLYETLNTRFIRHPAWLNCFKSFAKPPHEIFPDESYRDKALNRVCSDNSKKYSLVDLVIREILLDDSVKIDAILTLNYKDFSDICSHRNIINLIVLNQS